MPDEIARVLIWGKTYPELSSRYVETVCTGGVREDGRPIRLYPVPLRYMDSGKQYSTYDWIEAPISKSTSDVRPESFKVLPGRVEIVGHVDTGRGKPPDWAERRRYIFRDSSWQFQNIAALEASRKANRTSMGILTPGSTFEVEIEPRPAREEAEFKAKLQQVHGQSDLFHTSYKDIAYLPNKIWLHWRCASRGCECDAQPHRHRILDWGLLELARRDGWAMAKSKMEDLANLERHELQLFLGNYMLHQHQFGIIGLWYPSRQLADPQTSLL